MKATTTTKLADVPLDTIKVFDKVVELPAEPDRTGVAMDKLEDFHCRWPLGDPATPQFRFCGDRKVFGKSYCQHHLERAYNKMPRIYRRPVERPALRLVHPDEFEPA